jgi:thiamine-monophosphate kinase
MSGRPKYALVVISAAEELYLGDKIISLYEGINDCAKEYDTLIVGGDITRGQNLAITITVIGEAHASGVLMRSGAQVGDVIVVTGEFGSSGAALRILQNDILVAARAAGQSITTANSSASNTSLPYAHCLQQFLRPLPRLKESWSLVEQIGNRGALMDASDGLADALLQISQASNVGMQIDLKAVPIHEQTRQFASQANINPLDLALYAGEDYQLVACLSEKQWSLWKQKNPIAANYFKQIGTVNNSKNIQLMFGNEEWQKLDPKLIFQHIS